MEKVPVHNPSAMPIYVGATMIPAGETMHFDRAQVPPEFLPPVVEVAAAETQPDAMAELIGHSVKEIVEAMPELSDDDLARLGDLEQAKGDAARKTLLSALAEAQLSRAESKTPGGTE